MSQHMGQGRTHSPHRKGQDQRHNSSPRHDERHHSPRKEGRPHSSDGKIKDTRGHSSRDKEKLHRTDQSGSHSSRSLQGQGHAHSHTGPPRRYKLLFILVLFVKLHM